MKNSSARIVIIGGGTAGITVSSQLLKKNPKLSVTLIEPSEKHYYQPLWTLVGGGAAKKESTARAERSVIPRGADWIQASVTEIDPANQEVLTNSAQRVSYDYLVVAAGIQVNWHKIQGLPEALGKDGVCSIYDFHQAQRTWETIQSFEGGTAIFTQPGTPIKCGGAPQKIMYLADDTFRKKRVREKSRIVFASAADSIFAVKDYARTLEKVIERRGIETRYLRELIEIYGATRKAVFSVKKIEAGKVVGEDRETIAYDLLHVVPPMSVPDFIARSSLVAKEGPSAGWVDVDAKTLQHRRYPNVFSLGDSAGLPTSKTGAAVRKQAPVLVYNLLRLIQGDTASERHYDGYTSCPLVTGYGKLVLAEFDYDKKPQPSFPFDTTRERLSMYLLKKHFLPWMYWNLMLKGKEI